MKLFKILSSNKVYISFLIFFTFFVSESATIFLIYLKNVKQHKIKDNIDIESVLNADKDITYKRTILSMGPKLIQEEIKYRTDEIGAIFPSNIKNINTNENYVVFCGGSTTEASQNHEGKRPVDAFTEISGIKAINLAKAGKGFYGCIDTFKFFLENLGKNYKDYKKPSYYVVATSINTFSDFLREYTTKGEKITDISFFGTNLIKKIIGKYKEIRRNNLIGIKLSQYEHAIIEGCCFAPSKINNQNKSLKKVYWNNLTLKKSYENYLNKLVNSLNLFLKKYKINRNKIIVFIEPYSYNFKYEDLYRQYWKNIDSRQLIHSPNYKIYSLRDSSKIVNEFDNIYIDKMKNNNFSIINGKNIKFPKWSFYDAVHYTDYGSLILGNYYVENILKIMKSK